MDFIKLDKRIKRFENNLKNISDSSVNDLENHYFKKNQKVDILIPNYEYEYLCSLHLKIFKIIKKLGREEITDTDYETNRPIIKRLLELKIKVDRLVIEHKSYNKNKFKLKFKQSISVHKIVSQYLIYNGKLDKHSFLNEITALLVNNQSIEENQVKDFKRLFYKIKKLSPNKMIKWKTEIVELRAFFDVLFLELEIVTKPKTSDLFIQNNFIDSDKTLIDKSYYANLPSRKLDYEDYTGKWIDLINKIE